MSSPFDDIEYRDNLKCISFVADSQEQVTEKARTWINDFSAHPSIHLVGMTGNKTGKNIFIATVVYSDAITELGL